MLNDSPVGSKQWPVQLSLHDLAQKNLLNNSQTEAPPITTQQDFVGTIKNRDLLALVGGGGNGNGNKQIPNDPNFLPTLWDFKFASGTIPNTVDIPGTIPNPVETPGTIPPSPQQTTPPPLAIPPKINVTCRLIATTLTCTEATA